MKQQALDHVKTIMKKLIDNGYESFLVGGAVRDILLGLDPKDYDLCTNAHPQEVQKIFKNTMPTGKDYGTMTVIIDKMSYEVTTYRLEYEYDGRRPKVVKFANTLKEDLARRDFTINAMAMDIKGNLIDYFNGRNDLNQKIIRTVGNPKQRFLEDGLRMIRAIRFATTYDFKIHSDTYRSIHSNILRISKERLREEFNKILLSQNPSIGIKMIMDKGLWHSYGLCELNKCIGFDQQNPHHDKDVFEHIMCVIEHIEPKLELRLAALFHDMGKPNTFTKDIDGIGHFYNHHKESFNICKRIMTELKYSNKQIEYVSKLVYYHMVRYEKLGSTSAKKFINKVGKERLQDIFKLFIADRVSTKGPYDFDDIYRLKFACEKILNEKQPLSVKDLKINGHDLIRLGIPKGKKIGQVLNLLLEKVLQNAEWNEKEKLIKEVQAMYKDTHEEALRMEKYFFEAFQNLERLAPGSNESTQKASLSLESKKNEKINILDIGCGKGIHTLLLAKTFPNAKITAIDNHKPYVEELNQKIQCSNFYNRIVGQCISMFEMPFDENTLDLIWAEGSIYIIGFEKGLREWKKYLKKDGYLICSEISWLTHQPSKEILSFWNEAYPQIDTVENKIKQIQDAGYTFESTYVLPQTDWLEHYYLPLQKNLDFMKERYNGNDTAQQVINMIQKEINLYHKYKDQYSYVFYVMKK